VEYSGGPARAQVCRKCFSALVNNEGLRAIMWLCRPVMRRLRLYN